MNVNITTAEIQKLNLTEGDVLILSIKSDEIDMSSMNAIGDQLRKIFPNNKVLVMGVGSEGDIKFTVAKDAAATQQVGCGSTPASFCSDCNCGKKAAYEGDKG